MIIRKNSVLLLNNDEESFLNTISVKKALSLWFRGKIRILKSSDEKIHPGLKFGKPQVVALKKYVYIPYNLQQIKLSRDSIMLRDNLTCQYSGEKLKKSEIEIDHVIPRSRGGKNTWENLVVTSKSINNKKGNRTPEEAGLKLIRKPFRPTLQNILKNVNKKEWSEFLK